MQKKLFTSSFQAKFLKIRFTKVACTCSFLMYMQIFFFPSLNHSQGHIWAKMSHYVPPLTPKKWRIMHCSCDHRFRRWLHPLWYQADWSLCTFSTLVCSLISTWLMNLSPQAALDIKSALTSARWLLQLGCVSLSVWSCLNCAAVLRWWI